MPKVNTPFFCLVQQKDYEVGDEYNIDDAERIGDLQNRGFLEASEIGGAVKKVVRPRKTKEV